MTATHLRLEEALPRAESALRRLWPGWEGGLAPLKPQAKPLRATLFRVSGGPEPAVVKVWGPGNAAQAAAQAARQSAVDRAMAEGPFRVAGVLAHDASACALVMQDAEGPDLRQALETLPPDAAEALLMRAGGWVAAFHATSLRPAKCRPAGQLAWAERLLAEAESGARPVAALPRLRAGVAALRDLAAAARGLPSPRAVTHRDLTLTNLLAAADGTLRGIDFENDREDEPLRDLVSLGLDAMATAAFGRHPARALRALAQGHGGTGAAPAARLFLQRAFALGVVARTPPGASRRQAALCDAALWLLAQDRPLL